MVGIEVGDSLHNVVFNPQYVAQRRVVGLTRAYRQTRLLQKLLGIGQRNGARAMTGKRPHFRTADNHRICRIGARNR